MKRSTPIPDPFSARTSLTIGDRAYIYYRLDKSGLADLARAPMTVKILMENVLRNAGRGVVREDEARALASWRPRASIEAEVPFMPARVLLQDFTGVPAVVDLAAMRDAMAAMGGDPTLIEPLVPADLVIDHSVQVDRYRTPDAFAFNVDREYERNGERYQLLRWAQSAFNGLRVVPPGTGIVHQVNLEYLAQVVIDREDEAGETVRLPRHARRHRLAHDDGQRPRRARLWRRRHRGGGRAARPAALPADATRRRRAAPWRPAARLDGHRPRARSSATCSAPTAWSARSSSSAGDGLASLALADRATISNMSPEYGATAALFPIDDETLAYLRQTGRDETRVQLVERYAKENALWREPGPGPDFDESLELDLSTVEPTVAGPRRPQDKVLLPDLPQNFREAYPQSGRSHTRSTVGVNAA